MTTIRAILFDKDGTLFDFNATWGAWALSLLSDLGQGDQDRIADLAGRIGFDPHESAFDPTSPVIAGTGREVAELLIGGLADTDLDALERHLEAQAKLAPLMPAVPLRPLLARLRSAGLKLGVATNDFEAVAHRHLSDVADMFDFIAGFDSGHGGKPEPGMLLAFARHCGVPPADVMMVGDSRHDLIAGRAAGMRTLAVLTGVAKAGDLADLADDVRDDIGHIPALLGLA